MNTRCYKYTLPWNYPTNVRGAFLNFSLRAPFVIMVFAACLLIRVGIMVDLVGLIMYLWWKKKCHFLNRRMCFTSSQDLSIHRISRWSLIPIFNWNVCIKLKVRRCVCVCGTLWFGVHILLVCVALISSDSSLLFQQEPMLPSQPKWCPNYSVVAATAKTDSVPYHHSMLSRTITALAIFSTSCLLFLLKASFFFSMFGPQWLLCK